MCDILDFEENYRQPFYTMQAPDFLPKSVLASSVSTRGDKRGSIRVEERYVRTESVFTTGRERLTHFPAADKQLLLVSPQALLHYLPVLEKLHSQQQQPAASAAEAANWRGSA